MLFVMKKRPIHGDVLAHVRLQLTYDTELLSKKELKALRYVRSLTQNIDHYGGKSFDKHLYGTLSLLKHFNQSEDVCLAGLYHAIYGTEYFSHNIKVDRTTVTKYIGKYAEELVHVFCSPERDRNIINNRLNKPLTCWKDLLYILYANAIEQIPEPDQPNQNAMLGFCKTVQERIIWCENTLDGNV